MVNTASDDAPPRALQERVEAIRQAMQPAAPLYPPPLKMRSAGTGFFVARDGTLLTNNHVVSGCAGLTVETATGIAAVTKLIAADSAEDLALLKAEISPPAAATFRENVRLDGQRVAIVGYPDHGMIPLKPVLVYGQLTGPALKGGRHFMFHGDVRPGDSGGPLLDDHGLLVGVVFAKANTVEIYRATGQVVADVGFAISNDVVAQFLLKHHVAAATVGTEVGQTTTQPEKSIPFIARIGCWR